MHVISEAAFVVLLYASLAAVALGSGFLPVMLFTKRRNNDIW